MLLPIKTSYGTLYIEDLNAQREEEERVKLFDSDKRYLDYFDVDFLQHCAKIANKSSTEILNGYINTIKKCNSVEELCDYLLIKPFIITTSLEELLNSLNEMCSVNDYCSEGDALTNEYVNKIGNTYILVNE